MRDPGVDEGFGLVFVDLVPAMDELALRLGGIFDVFGGAPSDDAVEQRLDDLFARRDVADDDAVRRSTIVLAHDDVLRHVDQASREISRVGGAQRRIGETFARAVRRNEVFENRQALFERRLDRNLQDAARRVRHQPPHPAQLFDLRDRAARARSRHHEDGIERILRSLHRGRNLFRSLRPDLDRLVVLLVVGDEALLEILLKLVDFVLRLFEDGVLRLRNDDVAHRNRRPRLRRIAETEHLDRVQELGRLGVTVAAIAIGDEFLEHPLVDDEVVERLVPANRERLVEDHAADGRANDLAVPANSDPVLQADHFVFERDNRSIGVFERRQTLLAQRRRREVCVFRFPGRAVA